MLLPAAQLQHPALVAIFHLYYVCFFRFFFRLLLFICSFSFVGVDFYCCCYTVILYVKKWARMPLDTVNVARRSGYLYNRLTYQVFAGMCVCVQTPLLAYAVETMLNRSVVLRCCRSQECFVCFFDEKCTNITLQKKSQFIKIYEIHGGSYGIFHEILKDRMSVLQRCGMNGSLLE